MIITIKRWYHAARRRRFSVGAVRARYTPLTETPLVILRRLFHGMESVTSIWTAGNLCLIYVIYINQPAWVPGPAAAGIWLIGGGWPPPLCQKICKWNWEKNASFPRLCLLSGIFRWTIHSLGSLIIQPFSLSIVSNQKLIRITERIDC